MKFINCIVCRLKVQAKRIDKRFCDKCLNQHLKEMRRLRDRKQISKNRYKRYRSTDVFRKRARQRYNNMPDSKKKARYYVINAVRDGRITRPKNCERCGKVDTGVKRSMIEAHHYLGYDEKNWLLIEWLCTACHKIADRK